MTLRVAINGFGRIGRVVLRSAIDNTNIEIVHINDLTNDKMLAHLLKYDSVHGKFEKELQLRGGIVVGDTTISISLNEIQDLPWAEKNVDVVLECTGFFRSREGAQSHLELEPKRVVISAPGSKRGHHHRRGRE